MKKGKLKKYNACSKEDKEPEADDSTYINTTLDFEIRNKEKKDLLSGENSLTYDDIDVVYYQKGKEKVYDNPLALDGRKGYVILRYWDGKYLDTKYVHLYLNEPSKRSENIAYTYLRISGRPELYTFKVEYKTGEDYVEVQKVYLNGVLFWPTETGSIPVITIPD